MVVRADILDFGVGCEGSSFHFVSFGMTRSFFGGGQISGGCAAANLTSCPHGDAVISTKGRNLLYNFHLVISAEIRTEKTLPKLNNLNYTVTYRTDNRNTDYRNTTTTERRGYISVCSFVYGNTSRPFQITEHTNVPDNYDTDLLTATYTSGDRFVITAGDNWMMFYQSLLNLQTAPLYIDHTTGLHYYGEVYYNPFNPYDPFY